jgi:hypothetical protein
MHPDVVIEMFVDRTFVQDYPQVNGVQVPAPHRTAFDSSREVLLRLDTSNRFAGAGAYGHAHLVYDADGAEPALELDEPAVTDGLLLPEFRFPPSDDVIVAVDIDTPVVTTLDLFFQKKREPTFDRRRVCSEKIYTGANRVYFRLYAGDLGGRVYLRLRERGMYRIGSIEARAVRE